jgi:hypothetical protein
MYTSPQPRGYATWAAGAAFAALMTVGSTRNATGDGPLPPPKPAAVVDWATAARMDIESIHSTLRDNHPGPVDAANPGFSRWLADGKVLALEQAAAATSPGDYWRAVRLYTNGFRDGHIWFGFKDSVRRTWPGLLTMRDGNGRVYVTLNDGEPAVPLGAELLTCDGQEAEELQQKWVDPYRWNLDVPHERAAASLFLMTAFDGDVPPYRACIFRADGRELELTLRWTSIPEAQLVELVERAEGRVRGSLGLHQVGDVWFVSLPTFDLEPREVEALRTLISKLGEQAAQLLLAPWLVLDVRGNTGGNSGWGSEVAAALFGKEIVDRIEGQFDWTVDWRASKSNARDLQHSAAQAASNGQRADARYRRDLAKEIGRAAAMGLPYVRKPAPARFMTDTTIVESPFSGRVYLLTDGACASACLDFADLMRRLPGVVHIGLPTSADSIYIDNTGGELPSGRGFLSYSMKVYRNRIRGNNEWYEPTVRWPGGPMTDEAVAAWVLGLSR